MDEKRLEVFRLKIIWFFVRMYKSHRWFRSLAGLIPCGILFGIMLLYMANAVNLLEVIALTGAYMAVTGKAVVAFNREFRPMVSNDLLVFTTTIGAGLLVSFGYLTFLSCFLENVMVAALTFPLAWMVTATFFTSSLIWFLVFEERVARRAILSVFA
jgi:hypothetical protein